MQPKKPATRDESNLLQYYTGQPIEPTRLTKTVAKEVLPESPSSEALPPESHPANEQVLYDALKNYGKHYFNCSFRTDMETCDCGLFEVIEEATSQLKAPGSEAPPFPTDASKTAVEENCYRHHAGWTYELLEPESFIEGAKWAWAKAHEAKAGK
jgi:hypothetical protein